MKISHKVSLALLDLSYGNLGVRPLFRLAEVSVNQKRVSRLRSIPLSFSEMGVSCRRTGWRISIHSL